MIMLKVNGSQQTIHYGSTQELQSHLEDLVPPGEVICLIRVNGREIRFLPFGPDASRDGTSE